MDSQKALNAAMKEAVEFIHAEGWDASPTLFALVDSTLLSDGYGDNPLTLVIQDQLPTDLPAGSAELVEYCSRIAWPDQVSGVVLAQEIMFRDVNSTSEEPQPARLFSGVLREEGVELTLLQIRPTEEELEEGGLFAQDEIHLRGGSQVAPGVIAALRMGLEADPDDLVP